MLLADRLAERAAGRGRQILYALAAIVIIAAVAYGIVRWRRKHAEEAEQPMGRAIGINDPEICSSPAPGSHDPAFSTPEERSERAIQEFDRVAAEYGEPSRSEARYFIVTNEMVTDRATDETELQSLSQGSSEIAILAKFALAQTNES